MKLNKEIWKTAISFILTVVWLLVTIIEVVLSILVHPLIWITAAITIMVTGVCIAITIRNLLDIDLQLNKLETQESDKLEQLKKLRNEYQTLMDKIEELENGDEK